MRSFFLLVLAFASVHIPCASMDIHETEWRYLIEQPANPVTLPWNAYVNEPTLRENNIVFITPDVVKVTTSTSEKSESFFQIVFNFVISNDLLAKHVVEFELTKDALIKLQFSHKDFPCPQHSGSIIDANPDGSLTLYQYIKSHSSIIGKRFRNTPFGQASETYEALPDNSLRIKIINFSADEPNPSMQATHLSLPDKTEVSPEPQAKAKKRKRFFGWKK